MTYLKYGSISSDPNGFYVDNKTIYINPVYLNYYRQYALIFRVWQNSTNYTDYNYYYEFIPYSAIITDGNITYSGDTTFNGQDLAQYLPQAIVGTAPSGDSEGNGILGGIAKIFTGIYNTLFEVESGEILRAIEHIENNSPLGNATLLSGDIEILNRLTGTPQDFIISWNGINYQNQEIIPSRRY